MNTENKIEALLFALGEPLTQKQIATHLDLSIDEVREGLENLQHKYTTSGIVLIETSGVYTLGTHPDLAVFFDTLRKNELGGELSKASLETLTIILYKNGATRSEIDYIRGVNSTFILRNLTLRGLIEKREYTNDSRKIFYVPTVDTLAYMGVTRVEDLPDFENLSKILSEKNALLKEEVQLESNDNTI